MSDRVYTPEVDFIYGEVISPIKLAQACKAVQAGGDVKEVVKIILGRKD
jgi:hypothetical protein